MPIQTVAISNTFNELRVATNSVIGEVNNLSNGVGNIIIDSITANTYVGVSSNLNISGNTGSDVVSLASETLNIVGTNGITTSVASNTVSVNLGNNLSISTLDVQGTVTANTFSGSGASLTSIPNSATTAASANGASTIVARDASGDFTARLITATTFSGSGASLTSIPNSATTASSANGASTIVARDASGDFTANIVNATTFSGSGASLSSINATSITTGTVGTARLATGTANTLTYLRGDQTWATISAGGATLSNDTTTNTNTFYPAMANNATSGSLTSAVVSSTKFYFNPSTGTLNATVFNSLSDESLKENVSIISNAVSTVRQLEGVSFTWKENGIKSYGVIAQQLEKILPELVAGDDKKTVNYSGLIAFLINSIKELDDRVRQLEAK